LFITGEARIPQFCSFFRDGHVLTFSLQLECRSNRSIVRNAGRAFQKSRPKIGIPLVGRPASMRSDTQRSCPPRTFCTFRREFPSLRRSVSRRRTARNGLEELSGVRERSMMILCLLKSPFLLRQLMLRLPMDTLLGDDVGASRGAGAGGSRPAEDAVSPRGRRPHRVTLASRTPRHICRFSLFAAVPRRGRRFSPRGRRFAEPTARSYLAGCLHLRLLQAPPGPAGLTHRSLSTWWPCRTITMWPITQRWSLDFDLSRAVFNVPQIWNCQSVET
jgi:hypothetical protein